MSDATSDRNEKLKAAMRQKETPLNKGAPQVPCGKTQGKEATRYTSRGAPHQK
jgi:hypothetical protein